MVVQCWLRDKVKALDLRCQENKKPKRGIMGNGGKTRQRCPIVLACASGFEAIFLSLALLTQVLFKILHTSLPWDIFLS